MATGTPTKRARSRSTRTGPATRSTAVTSRRPRHWTAESAADWHEWSVVERLGWWAVLLAAFGVPTAFFKWGTNQFDLPKLTLLWSCSWVALAGVIASVRTGRLDLVRLRIRWAIAAFAGAQVVATLLSISPRLSLFGTYGRYMGLVPILLFLTLAFAVVCYCAATPDLVRHLLFAVAASTIVGCLFAVLEPLGLDLQFKSDSNYSGASVGLQGNSDFSAGVIAIGVPSLLYLRTEARQKWQRAVMVLGLVLVPIALYLLNSRGAIIALVVGVATTGLLARRLVPRWVAWGATAAGLLALVALLVLGVTRAGPYAGKFEHIPLLRSETFVQRIDIWRGTVGVIADRPLFGSGPDTLDLTLPAHLPAELSLRPTPVDTAHDVFLQYGAGSGLVGMGAYIVMLGWAIAQAVRHRDRLSATQQILLGGALGTLAAYIAQATFSIDELQLAVLGWVSLGAVLALTDGGALAARQRLDGLERTRRPMPMGLSLSLSALAVVLVALAAVPAAADARFNAATAAGARLSKDPRYSEQFRRAIEQAEALNPLEATYRAEAVRWVLEASDQQTPQQKATLLAWAEDQINSALDLQPGQTELRMRLARIYVQQAQLGDLSKWGQSDEIFRSLEARDPFDPKVRVERTRLLEAWRRAENRPQLVDELRDEAAAIEHLPVLTPTGWCQVSLIYQRIDLADDALRTARRCAELLPNEPSAQTRLAEAQAQASRR